ncbi:hypothetical protein [Georgenia thermotolerans]|uniref:DUF4386 family protein n=1 Tax=Georgenia thermotolerans TaxID=527326 RepID=A0A7J5UJ42_9MICO|nr:hypothetical protein [Georgenia thermotolerans]KAE8762301.1 hypothetical protein GB883_20040 [Georgenia thermotolerans]
MSRRLPGVLAALAGLVAMVVLITVPTVQCLACQAPLGSTDQTLVRIFTRWEHAFTAAAYAELLALFLFIWFLAYLHGELRQVVTGRVLATVAAVAGGLFGAGVLVQVLLSLAATTVAVSADATIARVVLAVSYEGAFALAAPVAALVGATSLAILRTRWLPRALGWAGLPVVLAALAWITPGIGAVGGMAWLVSLSVCLGVRALRPPPVAAPPVPAAADATP